MAGSIFGSGELAQEPRNPFSSKRFKIVLTASPARSCDASMRSSPYVRVGNAPFGLVVGAEAVAYPFRPAGAMPYRFGCAGQDVCSRFGALL